eukprot:1101846-Prymnesium_polylepis.1
MVSTFSVSSTYLRGERVYRTRPLSPLAQPARRTVARARQGLRIRRQQVALDELEVGRVLDLRQHTTCRCAQAAGDGVAATPGWCKPTHSRRGMRHSDPRRGRGARACPSMRLESTPCTAGTASRAGSRCARQ